MSLICRAHSGAKEDMRLWDVKSCATGKCYHRFLGLFDPEDEGTTVFRNAANYVSDKKASHPRKLESYLPTHPPTYPPTYLSTYLSIYLPLSYHTILFMINHLCVLCTNIIRGS